MAQNFTTHFLDKANSSDEEIFTFRKDLLIPAALRILGNAPGIPLNIFIALVSCRQDLAKGNYRWFILNLSVLDSAYCILSSTMQPWYILQSPYPTWDCKLFYFLSSSLTIASLCALPLLSLNRFLVLCHSKKAVKLFKPAKIFRLCIFADIFLSAIRFVAFVAADFEEPDSHCTANRENQIFRSWLIVACRLVVLFGIIAAFVLGLYFSWKIYKKLKNHQDKVLSDLQKQRFAQNRELLHLTVAQMILPIASQIPVIISTLLFRFFPDVPRMAVQLSRVLFVSNSTFNALLTIATVKPYKKSFVALWNGLRGGKFTLTYEEAVVTFDPTQRNATTTNRQWAQRVNY